MVRNLAVGVPGNGLAGRQRKDARLNVLPGRNGLDIFDGVVGSFLLLFREHGGLVYMATVQCREYSNSPLAIVAAPVGVL